MANGRITKRVVDALPVIGKEYVHWDGELKGFGVRVRPKGAMSFVALYRTAGRKSPLRRVTIGAVGKIEADKARDAAGKILAGAELGQDYAAERARLRSQLSISELCDLYLSEGCQAKAPSTVATDRGRVERHIKPLLGRKSVGDVTAADIEKFRDDVALGKTAADVKTRKRGRAIVEGGRGTATRTLRLLGGILTFAMNRGMRSNNPVRAVKKFPDAKVGRFLSAAELKRLGKALRSAKHHGANEAALKIIQLLALTGARKGEIAGLRWSEVDLKRGFLQLTASKTGAKVVPLGRPAIRLLASIPRVEESPFVFPATAGTGHFQGADKVWRNVRVTAGMPNLRIHDLRHSFASVGLANRLPLPMIGAILGHVDVKTTSRYAHLGDNPVRKAVDIVAGSVSTALVLGGRRSRRPPARSAKHGAH